MEKMANEYAANFIIKPLLLFVPALAFGLIEFSHYSETLLISVMPKPPLKKRLVKIESFGSIFWRM
jgi:hypothetical protein